MPGKKAAWGRRLGVGWVGRGGGANAIKLLGQAFARLLFKTHVWGVPPPTWPVLGPPKIGPSKATIYNICIHMARLTH